MITLYLQKDAFKCYYYNYSNQWEKDVFLKAKHKDVGEKIEQNNTERNIN